MGEKLYGDPRMEMLSDSSCQQTWFEVIDRDKIPLVGLGSKDHA